MFGFIFFITLFLIGEYLSTRFALPIPGSIIGLTLALCILAIRGKVDTPVKESSGWLLRYLPLMMVPIGVGIVRLVDAPPDGLWKLEIVLVISLVVGVLGAVMIMRGFLALQRSRTVPTPPVASQQGEG